MKYLRKFKTEADKNDWLVSSEFVTPNVLLTVDVVGYNVIDPATIPLHIEAIEDLTVSFSNTYEYSKDNATWSSGTSSTTISANAGEKVYFRASGLTPDFVTGIGRFTISEGKCNVAGNAMSMVHGANFIGNTEIIPYQFKSLFVGCSTIVNASKLKLPATTLEHTCYDSMFNGCTSLTAAPELPATTLAMSCYQQIFANCTSLTAAPELPATTLAEWCYGQMFANCTSLTTAPELLTTTLAEWCYDNMFYGCTSLTTAPELPATTLAKQCYGYMFANCTSLTTAPELPATTLAEGCYGQMFANCTSLTAAPELPVTMLANSCYQRMFYGCTSLTTAPELPATTLVPGCYGYMFYDCKNINYIKAMFTTEPSAGYTSYWVDGVPATGTFVKNAAATWNVTGTSGIPEGWTVETATE